ncbi:MAG: nicotinate phosphoribosyltransferase [Candidatus Nanopelagicales bacterium]
MRSPSEASTALLTDHYELTMLRAALRSGAAYRQTVFEVFCRRLPEGRRYGVVAGTGRLLSAIECFRFGDAELSDLRERRVVDDATLDFLAGYRFSGDIRGYGEGEVYLPGSPLLVVQSTFGEAVLLETLVLSILNHDSAIAAAASRMRIAAGDRALIEMGSRRTHEDAAVAAARAAYIAGFSTTSNLEAGRRYGIPTTGTSAHAFTLVHDDELSAFEAQVAALGPNTTLLVDTHDVDEGVAHALHAGGPDLGAVRLDSGDLVEQARRVRRQLDGLGARSTRIVVTSDLDEYAIGALASAPVDAYGVGTSLVTGSGAPTAALVYKLTARALSAHPSAHLEPVAKTSVGKPSRGGVKWGYRRLDAHGVATEEAVLVGDQPWSDRPGLRPLMHSLVSEGEAVGHEPVDRARERHAAAVAELPESAHRLSRGDVAIPTVFHTLEP